MGVDPNSRSLRILVVEDNADIAENIGDYLEAQGHVLDFALDGARRGAIGRCRYGIGPGLRAAARRDLLRRL